MLSIWKLTRYSYSSAFKNKGFKVYKLLAVMQIPSLSFIPNCVLHPGSLYYIYHAVLAGMLEFLLDFVDQLLFLSSLLYNSLGNYLMKRKVNALKK